MKKFLTLLFSICILFGCDKEGSTVTQIFLDQESLVLEIGSNAKLNISYIPSGVFTTHEWRTSSSSVATVTQGGVVSANGLGTATVYAITEEGLKASCKVTVTPIEATAITLGNKELTLDVGDTYELTYQISPDDTTDKTVTWSSSNESVATVKDGVVTAVSDGVCNVSVTINGSISDICSITVQLIPITSIIIAPQTTTIDIGASFQFEYSLLPENATDYGLVWKSSDESVAKVNAGMCVGVVEGNTTITVETSDGQIKASAELIVKDMYLYCEIGQSYTSKYGFDVVINSISTSENTTTQKNTCSINYTITNITSDQVLSEITFKCKTQSGEYESQYGFFGDLYPNESQTRSYSFTSLISDPFTRVELAPLFWNEVIDSSQSELIWKVE